MPNRMTENGQLLHVQYCFVIPHGLAIPSDVRVQRPTRCIPIDYLRVNGRKYLHPSTRRIASRIISQASRFESSLPPCKMPCAWSEICSSVRRENNSAHARCNLSLVA